MPRIPTIVCLLLMLAIGQSIAQELEPGAGTLARESLPADLQVEVAVPESDTELQALRGKIRRCLARYYAQHEKTSYRCPW